MNKMVNPKRVRRIKNFIYTLIILILCVPVILLIALSLRLFSALSNFNDYLEQVQAPQISSAITAPGAEGTGFVLDEAAISGSEQVTPGSVEVDREAPAPSDDGEPATLPLANASGESDAAAGEITAAPDGDPGEDPGDAEDGGGQAEPQAGADASGDADPAAAQGEQAGGQTTPAADDSPDTTLPLTGSRAAA